MSKLCSQLINLSHSWFFLTSSFGFGRVQGFLTMLFSFSSSVKENIGHFQKRKKQHELFHVIIFEISQALSSGSMYNMTLQAALPQNCSRSILYGKVMCSKRAMTQAVAFLILCLAACNERESTTAFHYQSLVLQWANAKWCCTC